MLRYQEVCAHGVLPGTDYEVQEVYMCTATCDEIRQEAEQKYRDENLENKVSERAQQTHRCVQRKQGLTSQGRAIQL